MNMMHNFDSYDEDALRESMEGDILNSRMFRQIDGEALHNMSVFWHKGRREFLPWTSVELSRRLEMTSRQTSVAMSLLVRKKLMAARGDANDTSQRIYFLTELGEGITRAELQRLKIVEPWMSALDLKALRSNMGMTRSDFSTALKIPLISVINYENGRVAIPYAIAENIKTAARRR